MKIILSAVLLTLALAQAAETKTKNLATETKTSAEKSRPPVDQTTTGGIAPGGLKTAPQGGPDQAYPPALWIHF